MAEETNATLMSMNDEPIELADDAADLRGRTVVDAEGEEIGHVDDLLVDDTERRVRFLRVKAGDFLGLGGRTFLIPIDAIERIGAERVHVDRDRDHVGGGPAYDPEVVVRGRDAYEPIYGHYGYLPFWMGGYAYPMFTPLHPQGADLRRSADPAAYAPRD